MDIRKQPPKVQSPPVRDTGGYRVKGRGGYSGGITVNDVNLNRELMYSDLDLGYIESIVERMKSWIDGVLKKASEHRETGQPNVFRKYWETLGTHIYGLYNDFMISLKNNPSVENKISFFIKSHIAFSSINSLREAFDRESQSAEGETIEMSPSSQFPYVDPFPFFEEIDMNPLGQIINNITANNQEAQFGVTKAQLGAVEEELDKMLIDKEMFPKGWIHVQEPTMLKPKEQNPDDPSSITKLQSEMELQGFLKLASHCAKNGINLL